VNERVKKLWVEALRSGEYKQTRGKLKHQTEDGGLEHCCLGVLCEIHDKEMGCEQSFKSIDGFPPPHILQWSGFNAVNARFKVENTAIGTVRDSISFLNDARLYTFAQIAALIEAQA
jgi:hypothetical protein